MKLVALGVNHKTAPVALRERVAFGDDLPLALGELCTLTHGVVIVSTCNRSEIYAYIDDTSETMADTLPKLDWQADNDAWLIAPTLVRWLTTFKGIAPTELLPYLYAYKGNLALTHWLRVAVGLDSMILGEPQILGQMRQAVSYAHEYCAITPAFDWLTQKIFGAARIVRRDTALGAQAVTLGFATAKLVTQIFDEPRATTLLIVAAGEMNRLVAHNVAELGVGRVIICNRSHARAVMLHDELQAMAATSGRQLELLLVPFSELAKALQSADIVSSCSGSMHTLIDKAMVKAAMKVRRYRPLLLVDLAVPRDIAPEVGQLDGVYLYSVDDLQHVIAGNLAQRKQAAVEAELLVGQLASGIEADLQLLSIGAIIRDYRTQAQSKKDELLTKAQARLAHGDNPESVLEDFAHQLTQTLTHPSLRLLRHSALKLDEEALTQLTQTLLGAYRP